MRHASRANDPEIRDHMSRANEAFVRGDLSGAWRHYSEVIQRDSRNFNAYKTLGEICQIRGNTHKCCFFWLLAAESGEADADFWGLVADMSAQLGHVDQAVHCYTQAIAKSDGVPWHYVCERALLYKEKKHYVRALEGFQKLLAAYPLEAAAVRHLASVYVEQKRYNDAVGLYMRVLDSNLHPPPGREYVVFDWTELHITCELLAAQEAWASGARLIRLVARWKQNRSDEAWWDEHDDAEFAKPRRLAYVRAKRPTACALLMARDYSLPIDIRFKLGCFRLELGQKNEAVEHFGYLFQQEDKSEVLDLFYEAGAGLEAHGHYAEAVWFLKYLFDNDANTELDLLLGKCLLETDSFRDAKTVLMKTLKRDPANVDAKLTLIEALYHTNEMDLATELMEDVAKSHVPRLPERLLETPHAADAADAADADPHDNLALIKNSSYYKKIRKNDLDASDRQAIEENATRVVRDKFTRMSRLQQAIDQRHDAAVSAWLKLASQLIEMFVEVRTFFPKNRKTVFKGIAIYKRKKSLAFDDKLHRIRDLFEGYADAENSRIVMTSRTEFRGLDYDTWLWVFVQYAYLLRHFKNDLKEATETIDLASNVSVFKQDKTRSMLLRIARLALGIRQQDYAISVANNIRYFLTSSQFSPSSYDFFMCCFGSGVGAWAVFSNYNHQKFFLRQIKAYDSMLFSSKVSGSAQLTIDVDSFKTNREHPHLLYIYACLLGSNRTFSSPIVYLTRAYRQYYNDPTICFVLGLAHVHRSMQRNSGNRHIQLLQGISYLLEYKSAREQGATVYEKQEIEYNFGRLFHMIGLPTLAVRHYEKVLSYHEQLRNDLDYDLLMEAAYNLSLIYIISGNSMLAKEITDRYLTV
ncbi:TPR-like protein [Metschnikowia bicuspidata var. bicuspidata NRRL YB-4993]|uniref:TPR-like protein n=1 Tax=Metschnikowia bicuspidata var. bicuspidata NRRL YB-4993 TaxID=869754 RepID=A0A1A0HCZ7_9ASCO|nr:TPR-like protein [Metschnikowia bicuspidata var. bicuspidata NRRL YB-4993]OBA21850.1 TPR-like protein [Metschnikowia bicuspidata var. bicuspidata NRRL YB-4993]